MKLKNIKQSINERIDGELTDEQFAELEQELKDTMDKLDHLQKMYRMQTGRNYQPFR